MSSTKRIGRVNRFESSGGRRARPAVVSAVASVSAPTSTASRGDKYVTVIIALTRSEMETAPRGYWTWPNAARSGRSRSSSPIGRDLAPRARNRCDGGFTGLKTATTEELPNAQGCVHQRMIAVYREPDRGQ